MSHHRFYRQFHWAFPGGNVRKICQASITDIKMRKFNKFLKTFNLSQKLSKASRNKISRSSFRLFSSTSRLTSLNTTEIDHISSCNINKIQAFISLNRFDFFLFLNLQWSVILTKLRDLQKDKKFERVYQKRFSIASRGQRYRGFSKSTILRLFWPPRHDIVRLYDFFKILKINIKILLESRKKLIFVLKVKKLTIPKSFSTFYKVWSLDNISVAILKQYFYKFFTETLPM